MIFFVIAMMFSIYLYICSTPMKYIFDVCGSFAMFTNGHLVKYLVVGRMLESAHEFFN